MNISDNETAFNPSFRDLDCNLREIDSVKFEGGVYG
jgi:hypothetical protein